MAQPPTVPSQPENKAPLSKTRPLVYALIAFIALIFIANVVSMSKKAAGPGGKSTMTTPPAAATHPQVVGFQTQQQLEAERDQQERMRQEQARAAAAGPQTPGPEAESAPPMTAAQAHALYGAGPNAPQRATSAAAERHAQARQAALAREKHRADALNSDTLAIDFTRGASVATAPAAVTNAKESGTGAPDATDDAKADTPAATETPASATPASGARAKTLADTADAYSGKLYRVFEGTVFEGVVTNHINGALAGPILISLTTDYYSHDHQQLLLPQGTRLIGEVKSVTGGQQTRLVVLFHRAICPDGFSINLEQYQGLDPLGTTGLSGKVDRGYLTAFSAAAVIGGLGGLTQIGSNGNVLSSTTEIRNGISQQTGQEATQVLNHFLNRLPVITLKEGSRARVYINRDIMIPSYNNHDVDPTL